MCRKVGNFLYKSIRLFLLVASIELLIRVRFFRVFFVRLFPYGMPEIYIK